MMVRTVVLVAGRALIAHDLAHAAQQRDGVIPPLGALSIGDAHAPAEHEAERAANTIAVRSPPERLEGRVPTIA